MKNLGDAYIFKLYVLSQDRNLEWFPRLRAKSLAADEGEGEQVELRSLQSQLESTQMLVKCLSQQLTELRDQVIITNPSNYFGDQQNIQEIAQSNDIKYKSYNFLSSF